MNNLNIKGEKCRKSKLTESNVLAIRRLYRLNPLVNKAAIASKLNVKWNAVNRIIRRETWKHI